MTKRLILISLPGGGFGFQTLRLINSLKNDYGFAYMLDVYREGPIEVGAPDGRFFRAPNVKTVTAGTALTTAFGIFGTFVKAIVFMIRHRPIAIVNVAMPQGLGLLLAGRILGIETIYIESITRVHVPSLTTRICARLGLAKHLFVQWESLVPLVPGAKFAGRVI